MNSLDLLIRRIKDRITVSNEDAVDIVKQYWDDAVDTVKGYWQDVDEAIVEETGIPQASLSQLLDDNRQAHSYANVGGNSGVASYDLGEDWFLVNFTTGSRYLYTTKSATREQIEEMKRYANDGKGLNSYIMRTLKTNYAGRNVKGEILIKPGMEHYSRHAFKRIELLEAYRNTMNTVSNEGLVDNVKKFLGFSNKGTGIGMTQKDKQLGHLLFAIADLKDTFASNSWMKKQTFVTGPIKADNIGPELDGGDIFKTIQRSDKFITQFVKWYEQVNKRTLDIHALARKYTDPNELATAVNKLPKLEYSAATLTDNSTTTGELQALDETTALKAAKEILKQFQEMRKCYRKDAGILDFQVTKGYSGQEMFFGDAAFAKQYTEYKDRTIACLRYIDRSIKGKVSVEHFDKGVKMSVLNKFKIQIETAGTDGLDPVARQFMAVSLESLGGEQTNSFEAFSESTVPSMEDLLGSIKKFFTKGKDTAIYDTVGKGFLQDLVHEVKKYTDPNWVKTLGVVEPQKVSIDGANLIVDFDKVVPEFIKACQANRVEHHKVAEQAFSNMETVMDMVKRKQLDNSANVEKAITIMKATRQLKAPKVEVPKVTLQKGEVKTLNAEQIVDHAKKVHALFDVLGADLTFVKRWNDNFINTHAWMDWKYVGKSNYSELYQQVKDPKFTELYQKAMENVYDMHRVGVEFHKLQPYIMAVFQLIEKSVKDK